MFTHDALLTGIYGPRELVEMAVEWTSEEMIEIGIETRLDAQAASARRGNATVALAWADLVAVVLEQAARLVRAG